MKKLFLTLCLLPASVALLAKQPTSTPVRLGQPTNPSPTTCAHLSNTNCVYGYDPSTQCCYVVRSQPHSFCQLPACV
jgi:hypothetical protein